MHISVRLCYDNTGDCTSLVPCVGLPKVDAMWVTGFSERGISQLIFISQCSFLQGPSPISQDSTSLSNKIPELTWWMVVYDREVVVCGDREMVVCGDRGIVVYGDREMVVCESSRIPVIANGLVV